MAVDKQEHVDEAAMASVEAGQVEAPYSIYTSKEKWIIVGMVALAGFYRYVPIVSFRNSHLGPISRNVVLQSNKVSHHGSLDCRGLQSLLRMRVCKVEYT